MRVTAEYTIGVDEVHSDCPMWVAFPGGPCTPYDEFALRVDHQELRQLTWARDKLYIQVDSPHFRVADHDLSGRTHGIKHLLVCCLDVILDLKLVFEVERNAAASLELLSNLAEILLAPDEVPVGSPTAPGKPLKYHRPPPGTIGPASQNRIGKNLR